MGKIVSFMNNKGGVAKTTSAYTIGCAWAKMGKKILFVDLDSQANLTSMLSSTNPLNHCWTRTIEDAFIAGPQDGLPIEHTDDPLIDFIPADLDLANFESDTRFVDFKEYLLKDLLSLVKDSYDYIIIDCPPNLGQIIKIAMIASDYLVLVTQASGMSYKGTQMVISLYNEVIRDPRKNPNLKIIGILITMFQKDKVSELFCKQLVEDYSLLVVKPYIRKTTKLVQATSFDKSIFDIDPTGRAAEDYLKASQEILMRIDSDIRLG